MDLNLKKNYYIHRKTKRWLILCCCFLLIFCRSLVAQVNIETLRRAGLESGFHHVVSVHFGFISGNTNFLNLKSSFRSDYNMEKYKSFLVANFQRREKGDDVFINKGFIHLRIMRSLIRQYNVEVFVQKEFNDFIKLNDRNLVGTGLRMAIIQPKEEKVRSKAELRLYLGLGLMFENEKIDKVGETSIYRSTNYLTLNWQVEKRVRMSTTGYYQVDVTKISDYRVLFEGKLGFNLTDKIVFSMVCLFRFDNKPPGGIEKHDLEITNGVSLNF